MNQNLFDIAFQDQNLQNNITYSDILKAIYLNIEGFIVTELSNSFSKLNGYSLLGNIIDKNTINELQDAYLNNRYVLNYYHLKKSNNDSIWFNEKITIQKPIYDITMQNYSL